MSRVCPYDNRPRLVACLVAALALVVSACGQSGPEMGRVRGKVTYQGKPLEKGVVSFIPTDANRQGASGPIQPDGSYELQTREPGDGAELGEYRVGITDVDPDAFNTELPGEPVKVKSMLPPKYQDQNTSGLTATVKSGGNTIDFDPK